MNKQDSLDTSIYRYIVTYTKRNQLMLILLTLVSMPFVYAVLEVPKIIINSALTNEGVPDQLLGIDVSQVGYLLLLCGLFLALVLINGALKYANNLYRGVLGERMLRQFRMSLFSRLLRFPGSRFKGVSQAEIIPMVTAETEPLGGFIGDAFALPAFQGGLLLTYLVFIFNQDPLLGLAAVALYPFQIWLIPRLQKRVNQLAKQRVQQVRRFSDKVGESISGLQDIRTNGTVAYERHQVLRRLSKIYDIRYDIYRKKFLIKFLNNFLGQITPFFFYAVGGYFVIKGELSLGALVAVLAAYKDLASPWKELLKFYQIYQDIRVKYSQVIKQFEIAHLIDNNRHDTQIKKPDLSEGSVEGIALSYGENGESDVLEGVSFDIKKGAHLALIGERGSGQGILTQLIVRLLSPTLGQVMIGGRDLSEIPDEVLGQHVGYVDQQSYVFKGTVSENMAYAYNRVEQMDDVSTTQTVDPDLIRGIQVKEVNEQWLEILETCDFDQDVYGLGMRSPIKTAHPELAQGVLLARDKVQQSLASPKFSGLVDVLDPECFNNSLSVAENLFFGVPKQAEIDFEQLIFEPSIDELVMTSGLKTPLIHMGVEIAKIMSEIFADVPSGSPVFQQYSFVSEEALPQLKHLAAIESNVSVETLSVDDANELIRLSLKLTSAKHRLGLMTDELKTQILAVRKQLKHVLGGSNELIDFYDNEKIVGDLSLEDNLLFGRIASSQAGARKKVGDLITQVVEELGLRLSIIEFGMDYEVGVGGSRLSSVQRQKLVIARTLFKRPQLLVMNEATTLFDKPTEQKLCKRILIYMSGKTVVWVFNSTDNLHLFERILTLEKGRVIADEQVNPAR